MAKPKFDPTAALRMTLTQAPATPVQQTAPVVTAPVQASVPVRERPIVEKTPEVTLQTQNLANVQKHDQPEVPSASTIQNPERQKAETAQPTTAPEPAPQTIAVPVEPSSISGTERQAAPVMARQKPVAAKGTKTARPTYYLYPEDIAKIRQLSAYLQGQHGDRVNDSHIIRAALRMVTIGQPLVEAIRYVKSLDRRATGGEK